MQAIAFGKHGAPSVLAKVNVPHPHGFNAANNVLIKVHAASINPVDKIFLKGDMKLVKPVAAFPHVISYDVSGVVEVADSAGKFKVGDAVLARLFGDKEEDGPKTPWFRGAMAEYCVARVENAVLKPDNLSFEEAASIPLAGMTAYQGLKLAGLQEGGSIFISGGAGGVGTLAIQLAKHVFKAGLVATTASAGAKEELVRELGADVVVDYRSANFEETLDAGSFDCVFDCTNESLKAVQITKQGGKIVTIAGTPTLESIRAIGGTGFILSVVLSKRAKRAEYKAAVKAGVEWEHLFLRPSGEDLQSVVDALAEGAIKPVLDNVWAFESEDEKDGWKGAFTQQFGGRARGKCVVKFV